MTARTRRFWIPDHRTVISKLKYPKILKETFWLQISHFSLCSHFHILFLIWKTDLSILWWQGIVSHRKCHRCLNFYFGTNFIHFYHSLYAHHDYCYQVSQKDSFIDYSHCKGLSRCLWRTKRLWVISYDS